MKWWRRRGLRFKIALGVFLVMSILLSGAVSAVILVFKGNLYQAEKELAKLRNEKFVTSIQGNMIINDWNVITETAAAFGQEEDDQEKDGQKKDDKEKDYQIEDIAVFTRRKDPGTLRYERTVLAVYATGFPDGRTIDRSVVEKKTYSAECAECHKLGLQAREQVIEIELKAKPTDASGQRVLRTAVPIANEGACSLCHGTDRKVLGMSLIDFRLDNYNATLRKAAAWMGTGGVATILLVVVALYVLVNRMALKPLRGVVASTQAVAQGQWDQRVPVRSEDEIGKLGGAFNEMTAQLSTTYAELQLTLRQSEEQADALQRALDDVQHGQAEQSRLMSTIRQMSVPVVPVHQGVLVTPLVGLIDEDRAQQIIEALLGSVENQRARVVIIDITGVPMVDTAVAQTLLQAALAVRLLGAEAILVGISPQVAETIVSLGVDLADLVTQADLQSGVEYALKRLSK